MSNLFVDKISGKSGTSSGAPITLSGDTAILGSGVDINTSLATATFPAGHIIQVVTNTYNLTDSTTVSNNTFVRVSDGSGNYHWGCQIDNVGASNHVFITTAYVASMSRSGLTSSSDKNSGGGFGLFRGATAICEPQHTSHYHHLIEASHNLTNMNFANQMTFTFMDEAPGTGTNNYYLGFKATNTTNMSVMVYSASTWEPFRMTLFEVQS